MPSGRSWPTIETTSGGSAPSSSACSPPSPCGLGAQGSSAKSSTTALPSGWASLGRSSPSPSSGSVSASSWAARTTTPTTISIASPVAVGSLATLIAQPAFFTSSGVGPASTIRSLRSAPPAVPSGWPSGVSCTPSPILLAAVILLAIGVIGVIIVTGSSARTVEEFVAKSARMIPALFGQAFRGLFDDPTQGEQVADRRPEPAMPEPEPEPEIEPEPEVESEPAPKKRAKKAEPVAEAEQQSLPVPKAVGNWKLPPMSMLSRSEKREVDKQGRQAGRTPAVHARSVRRRPPCSNRSSVRPSPGMCSSSVRA